jgi:hypothetical protein
MPYLKIKACATKNYNKLFASRYLRYSTFALDRPKYLSPFALLCRILDASRNHGSGSGDMYAYIPTSDFSAAKTSDFVYLYAHFGNSDASQSGFEEWALVHVAPIPEMNALFPVLCGRLCGAALTAAAVGAAGEHDVVRAEPDWR